MIGLIASVGGVLWFTAFVLQRPAIAAGIAALLFLILMSSMFGTVDECKQNPAMCQYHHRLGAP
jgi:hypothetical protein